MRAWDKLVEEGIIVNGRNVGRIGHERSRLRRAL